MIRLIGRRLIIPQGDTGTFKIPTQGEVALGDISILAIYDTLTQKTVREIRAEMDSDVLTFHFTPEDTLDIEPDDRGSRYTWDIVIKRNPYVEQDGQLKYAEVDSYYAAFSVPDCEIRQTGDNANLPMAKQ